MAFDLDFLTYDSVTFSTASQTTAIAGFRWSHDGSKFYVNGHNGFTPSVIYQYDAPTPFSLTGASYASTSVNVANNARGLAFNSAGTRMFMWDGSSPTIYQWNLSTPWDVSSATNSGNTLNVSAQETTVTGVDVSDDGAYLYVIGLDADHTRRYTMSTPGDLSTATYTDGLNNITLTNSGARVAISTGGGHVLMSEFSGSNCWLWVRSLATPWSLAGGLAVDPGSAKDVAADIGAGGPDAVDLNPKGTRLVVGRTSTLYQFSMPPARSGILVGSVAA